MAPVSSWEMCALLIPVTPSTARSESPLARRPSRSTEAKEVDAMLGMVTIRPRAWRALRCDSTRAADPGGGGEQMGAHRRTSRARIAAGDRGGDRPLLVGRCRPQRYQVAGGLEGVQDRPQQVAERTVVRGISDRDVKRPFRASPVIAGVRAARHTG